MPSKITKLTGKKIGGVSKKNVKKINKKSCGKIQKNIFLTKKRLFKKYKGGGTGVEKNISDVFNQNDIIYIINEVPDKNGNLFQANLFRTGVNDTIKIKDILYEINEILPNILSKNDLGF